MRAINAGLFYATLTSIFVDSVTGLFMERQESRKGGIRLNKAILEMLHIDKVSATHQAKPHPYMRRVYELLDTLDAQDLRDIDGTLVQSFRSVFGQIDAPPGWIWFNVTGVDPSMRGAELVLFRKTLHTSPLSVTVTLHGLVDSPRSAMRESSVLEERMLTLDQRPSSGYDVFDATPILTSEPGPLNAVGFQLRYTDESGSLVLHEALTQSFYSLNRDSLREPLLVIYHVHPREIKGSQITR